MPKLLFSKIRFYHIRHLMQNEKQPRRKGHKDIQHIMVSKTSDTYPSELSWHADHKLYTSLEKMLWNERFLAAFRAFLQSEFSDENIDFWLACENFRATTSQEKLCCKAKQIYQEFIHPAASREINVDHHIKEAIKKSLDKPTPMCFDEAQRQVYLLMERDSCPRFLNSDAYMSLTQKNRSVWYM
ncbi:regulator of G-protein signaling 21-like isoform X2 [Thalassophryne amazonica]|uniref:regulator of G-protein signaling 21-like isoform X2 n=1 Tax=Thalassophryne amazonica TaxID=390379 RepID=UPI001470C47E|nr:regulator of G-protein signaling 21-like isoform X2 [Thalassophryne amazonica]